MKRDPLFFRLFKELPQCFFRLVGRPEGDAKRYDLDAIEYKETAVRLDGVYLLHVPLMAAASVMIGRLLPSDSWSWASAVIGCAVLPCILFLRWFERPVLRIAYRDVAKK